MAASASPRATMSSTLRALAPRTIFGPSASKLPSVRSVSSAYTPAGTAGVNPSASLPSAGACASVSQRNPASSGASRRTRVSAPVASTHERVASCADSSSFAGPSAALANSAAGAPSRIWCARSPLAPKEKRTFAPG